MKKYLTYLISAALFGGIPLVSHAETRSIEFPYFESNNSRVLDIRKVVADDDTTFVYADLYSRPDAWVRIGSSSCLKGRDSGKICKLIAIDGLVPDKETYPGANWHIPFVMKFEPLEPQDMAFDYIEGGGEGDFKILGVSLEDQLSSGSVRCRLEGTVSNPEYSRLMLMEFDEDFRTGRYYGIPVDSGRFTYDFYCEPDRIYSLVPFNEYMRGAWGNCYFYTTDGIVRFDLQDETRDVSSASVEQKKANDFFEFQKNWQSENMQDYMEMIRNMTEKDMYIPEFTQISEKIRNSSGAERMALLKDFRPDNYLSDKGKALRTMGDSLRRQSETAATTYLAEHPSLSGIKYVLDGLLYSRGDRQQYIDFYEKSLRNYRLEHPYHDKVSMAIAAYRLQPGKKYIDYELPDSKGGKVRISDLIGGRLTLVDLWASWCGPCRRNSTALIPIYKKYKDAGFNVIGIAREKQASDMQNAIEQDGYPWLNYLDLNDENKIWQLHGVGNAGGATFLVDGDGTVIAVNPTPEDLDKIVGNKLSKNQ